MLIPSLNSASRPSFPSTPPPPAMSAGARRRRAKTFGQAWRRRGKREIVEAKMDGPIRSEFHVVFRRKDSHLTHESDYREYRNIYPALFVMH